MHTDAVVLKNDTPTPIRKHTDLIPENDTSDNLIQKGINGQKDGMQTLNQALARLVKQGHVSE